MRNSLTIALLFFAAGLFGQYLTVTPSYLRNVQAGDTLTRGQLAYINSANGRAYPADGSDRDKKAVGVVAYSTSSGANTQVYCSGILIDSSLSMVPGTVYFPSTTPGAWTSTRPLSYGYQEAIVALDTMVFKVICGEWVHLPISLTTTIDFASVDEDGGTLNTDITVTGASVGDPVIISRPASTIIDQVDITAWVNASNTVRIRIYNRTVSTVDFSSESYTIKVFK